MTILYDNVQINKNLSKYRKVQFLTKFRPKLCKLNLMFLIQTHYVTCLLRVSKKIWKQNGRIMILDQMQLVKIL